MININVLAEGPTEVTFVTDIVTKHFEPLEIYLYAFPITTGKKTNKETNATMIFKGGMTSYKKIKPQLLNLTKSKPSFYITTMFDLYGLANDFPGYDEALKHNDPIQMARLIEKKMLIDLNLQLNNYIPYISLYEFESLLFSDVKAFTEYFDEQKVNALYNQRLEFPTPEHINNSRETAPSKRILKAIPEYRKLADGNKIAQKIGLEKIRQECQHFNEWLTKLENLPPLN